MSSFVINGKGSWIFLGLRVADAVSAGFREPSGLGFQDNAVALGELHEALGLGLDADVSKGTLRIGGDASLSGRVNADDAAFGDFELVTVHLETASPFDHDIHLLIAFVGVEEGYTDAWG